MEHDVQAQNDQQDSQDQLQAVGDEHSAPSGLTGRDGDSGGIADGLDHRHETLHQSGEGDSPKAPSITSAPFARNASILS